MQTRTWLIINSVACVLAFVPAFGVQIATVMSGSSAQGQGIVTAVATTAVILALALPWTFVASLIGSWICFAAGLQRVALGFAILPWALLAVLALLLTVIFTRS